MKMQATMLFLVLYSTVTLASEPPACSRFHYEEQTLEKMIRLEFLFEKMKAEFDETRQQVLDSLSDLKTERNSFANDLEMKSNDLEAVKANMERELDRMKSQNYEKMADYAAEIEKFKGSVAIPTIAFKAHHAAAPLNDGKIIIFTENLLNEGSAYNNQTGVFVASVRGIYLFSAQICLPTRHASYFGISVEERMVTQTVIGDTTQTKCYIFDAVTTADAGEQVTVKCTASCAGDSLWENKNLAANSFSGSLLHMYTN